MPMTKKERAALESERVRSRAAIAHADTMLALRWRGTAPVLPDLQPPEGTYGATSEGWKVNVHTKTVERAWSQQMTHGSGWAPETTHYRTALQGSRALYSTKRRALEALRFAVAWQAAEALRAIDLAMEAEGA